MSLKDAREKLQREEDRIEAAKPKTEEIEDNEVIETSA